MKLLETLSDKEIRIQLALGSFSADELYQLKCILERSFRYNDALYEEVVAACEKKMTNEWDWSYIYFDVTYKYKEPKKVQLTWST